METRPRSEPQRPDVLIAEARAGHFEDRGWMITIIDRLVDTLEAATGGMHIDAKHWAKVARSRARIAELESLLAERVELITRMAAVIAKVHDALGDAVQHDGSADFAVLVRARADLASTDSAAVLREHTADAQRSVSDILAANFRDDVDYGGDEVIGRIRMIVHVIVDPHTEGERCLVCDNDASDPDWAAAAERS